MQDADEHACRGAECWSAASRMTCGSRGSPTCRSGAGRWRSSAKRRYRAVSSVGAQRVFTERSEQVPPRCRLTGRLRAGWVSGVPVGAGLSDVAPSRGVLVERPPGAGRRRGRARPGSPAPVRMLAWMKLGSARRAGVAGRDGWRLSNP